MYTVSRSTRSASTAAVELRALVGQAVPTLVAKALTFTVQKAQSALVAEMSSLFKGGATPYTLKSTRIETATAQDLSARVAVKDRTTGNGTLPEDYLFPQVFGGPRKEKRFERAMRYAGLLKRGERTILSRTAPQDAFGNLNRNEMQGILSAFRVPAAKAGKRASSKARPAGVKTPYMRGQLRKRPGVSAIFYADQGEVFPLLLIVKKQPTYTKRLDFEGIARATAAREFEPTFRRLLAASTR